MAQTAREALIAEMLGELDTLLQRCEALQGRMLSDAATLDAAGERFRAATIAFTEQAKQEVTGHILRKAAEAGAQLEDRQRAELERAMLAVALHARTPAPTMVQRARRLAELAAVALGAGLSAAWFMWWLLR